MTAPLVLRDRPDVDIVIPGWQNFPLTRRCIASLRQTKDVAYRVIYVDNGSKPREVASLIHDYPELVIVRLPFNHGFVRGTNCGLAQSLLSGAHHTLLLNNDVAVPNGDPGWLARMLAAFDGPRVGAVGAVSDNVAGAQKRARAGEGVSTPPILIGFALLLSKAALQAVGFLDESFEPGNYEDWDYSFRLREAGFELRIAESVWLHHGGHKSFERLPLDFNQLLARNLAILRRKWSDAQLAQFGIDVSASFSPEPALPPLDDYAGLMPFIESHEAGQAAFLGELLYGALAPRSVVDLGCGPGIYLTPFKAHGCEVTGIDAEPAAGTRLNGDFRRHDLREPFRLEPRADLALCIETAEHLQPEFADQLVDNCTRNARIVFWSAARPGQGGEHHHHEQPPAYWEAKFAARGWEPHPRQAELLAAIAADPECRRVGWLLDNARVFQEPAGRSPTTEGKMG